MTDTDQPATTEARVVTTFRPGTVLADLARVLAELDTSCREQRETIDRLIGERDRARDLAARLEAETAQDDELASVPRRCGCCGAQVFYGRRATVTNSKPRNEAGE